MYRLTAATSYQADSDDDEVKQDSDNHAHNATIGETEAGYAHRSCTPIACQQLGCIAVAYECPATQADYQHSLEAGDGHPLQYVAADMPRKQPDSAGMLCPCLLLSCLVQY